MNEYRTFSPTSKDFKVLNGFASNGRENECRDALIPFGNCLAKFHDIKLEAVFTEYSSFDGTRGDLILCGPARMVSDANLIEGVSLPRKEVILYECKSPACKVFTNPRNGRNIPSPSLVEAETQLIEYFDALNRDHSTLRESLKTSLLDIKMGGIIIGNSSRKANENILKARHKRQLHLYKNIKLLTWSEIICHVKDTYPSFNPDKAETISS